MVELAKPFEIYEWKDGETKEFTILRYEEGETTITPRDGREPKTIAVLRIHVPVEEKPEFRQYWDQTSSRLVAQLKAILPTVLIGPYKVTITAIGRAPLTHFSVSRLAERPA